jgi:hypothetical protein
MSCNLNTYRLTFEPSNISLGYTNVHKLRMAKTVISIIRSNLGNNIKTDNHKIDPYDVDLFEYMPEEYLGLSYSVFAAYKRKILPLIYKYKDVFVWKGSYMNISAEIKTCKAIIPDIYKQLDLACRSGKAESHMSEYIALGLFSMQLLFHLALKYNNQDILDQFIWRVFYYSTSNLSDRVLWNYNLRRHESFCRCMTGYEYIDAIMNCLIQTGYITNKQRMLVGSFYCKILYLPWREGSLIFERYLSDYDYKLNIGNWLWCSQIQFDNQIFVRHFSPDIQAKKYDHDKTFRIEWLPYMSDDESISVHQMTKLGKPKLVVDYTSAKEFYNSKLRHRT